MLNLYSDFPTTSKSPLFSACLAALPRRLSLATAHHDGNIWAVLPASWQPSWAPPSSQTFPSLYTERFPTWRVLFLHGQRSVTAEVKRTVPVVTRHSPVQLRSPSPFPGPEGWGLHVVQNGPFRRRKTPQSQITQWSSGSLHLARR